MTRIATCTALLLLSTVSTVTAACGSSSSSVAGGSTTGSSAASTSATPAASSATPAASSATATSAAAGDNPVKGADLCAFLTTMEPKLKADGSPVGALADLSIELANWVGDHPTEKPRTPADVDEATVAACPQVRTAILASLKATSFAAVLG